MLKLQHMNSYLIVGANNQERLEKINLQLSPYQLNLNHPHPDLLLVEAGLSIGINQIRQLQKFLSRKPYQLKIKAVVISEAEKLTLAAQNAFLKTLEEPPANSLIILACPNQEQLLATIVSRCQTIKLNLKPKLELDKKTSSFYLAFFSKLFQSKVGERLKLIDTYSKSREEAISFCEQAIVFLREELKKQKSPVADKKILLQYIKALQKSLKLLNQNVNSKLVLDNLVLDL